MKVKIIATIWGDLKDIKCPDVINSDTIGDYKAELDATIHNKASEKVFFTGAWEDMQINSVEPYDDGIEEYGLILDSWMNTYPEEVKRIITKYHEG